MAILIKLSSLNDTKPAIPTGETIKGETMNLPVIGDRMRMHTGPGTMFITSDIVDVMHLSDKEAYFRTQNSYYRLIHG
jgi:hypothetical protein